MKYFNPLIFTSLSASGLKNLVPNNHLKSKYFNYAYSRGPNNLTTFSWMSCNSFSKWRMK